MTTDSFLAHVQALVFTLRRNYIGAKANVTSLSMDTKFFEVCVYVEKRETFCFRFRVRSNIIPPSTV